MTPRRLKQIGLVPIGELMGNPPEPGRVAFLANIVYNTEELQEEQVLAYLQGIFHPQNGVTPEMHFNWKAGKIASISIRLRRAL